MRRPVINILLALMISGIANHAYCQKNKTMAQHSTQVMLGGIYGQKKQVFENNTKLFLDGINKAYMSNTRPSFTTSIANTGLNIKIGDLWSASPFLSASPNVYENLLSTTQGTFEVRNIQIVIEEAQKDYEQQDAVLIFNSDGIIIDFKIALGYNRIAPILNDTVSVTDFRRRNMIINFVEDFRTSYNIKDIDFLQKVFSDKALIITGRLIQETNDSELKPKVKYTVQTKAEYLTNIKSVFSRAKTISINFDNIKVVRHPSFPDIYGVRVVQDWNSQLINGGKYHDLGYVFLVIDFSNEEKPKIWVRTWALEDFFSLNSFVIN